MIDVLETLLTWALWAALFFCVPLAMGIDWCIRSRMWRDLPHLGAWWHDWRLERANARPNPHRFELILYPDPESDLTIPVWFNGEFDSAAGAAIELANEPVFDGSQLLVVKAVDRQWAYIREPDDETDDVAPEGSEVLTELEMRTLELLCLRDFVDDSEWTEEISDAIRRLDFIRQSDATPEDKAGAWEMLEEDIRAAAARAAERRTD
jgi:hypothetical protein